MRGNGSLSNQTFYDLLESVNSRGVHCTLTMLQKSVTGRLTVTKVGDTIKLHHPRFRDMRGAFEVSGNKRTLTPALCDMTIERA